ncbi:MAG: hypothetical protein HQL67_11025 [Magnetococcales bacterium]|nr:hypothetical protein [Magnetococcales bacterium]
MQLPNQKQNSFVKGLLTFYLIFLAIFFAAAPFLTLWLYAEADLSLTLLPQLIGFCLQGAFLVVVFAIYEKRSTINTKRNHKFVLRTFLSSFVTPCLGAKGHADEGLICAPAIFANAVENLKSAGISETVSSTLKQVARQNITSMESLTVLAAQVDHFHLKIWSNILHESRSIQGSSDPVAVKEAILRLLENIRQFDELIIY